MFNFSLEYPDWEEVRTTFVEYQHIFAIPDYSSIVSYLLINRRIGTYIYSKSINSVNISINCSSSWLNKVIFVISNTRTNKNRFQISIILEDREKALEYARKGIAQKEPEKLNDEYIELVADSRVPLMQIILNPSLWNI